MVTSAIAQNILQAQEILGLHADGNNSGQCQICAFGKYEEGSLLIETMPAKSGRNWLRYQFRQTTSKETCNPFGSEHVHSASSIISNMT